MYSTRNESFEKEKVIKKEKSKVIHRGKERDSNPRYEEVVQRISNPPLSSTQPPLPIEKVRYFVYLYNKPGGHSSIPSRAYLQ